MQTGCVCEVRLVRFAVMLDGTDAPADGHPDDEVERDVVVPARRHLRCLGDDLVHRRIDETLELNLADRLESTE